MTMLGETQNNGVYRSLNGGYNCSPATTGLSGSAAWVGPIVAHPDSDGIFYTARQQVFKTTNSASSWFPISSGTTGTIREMAISKSNPNVLYTTSGGQVYRSSNGGVTFTPAFTGLPTRIITAVAVHPDSEDVVLVTYSGFGAGKVFRSTNGGSTWNDISGNLPDTPINDILLYYPGFATSTYLVATDVGVFISTNYGSSWSELADGLPNTVAIHLDYNVAGNKIRVATHGRGVYETSLITGVVDHHASPTSRFRLYQNFPNPFNPPTHFRYALPEAGRLRLSVYDVLGREVSRVVDEQQAPGTYTVMWDAHTMASGVYFYRLTFGAFTETKKLLLMR